MLYIYIYNLILVSAKKRKQKSVSGVVWFVRHTERQREREKRERVVELRGEEDVERKRR